MTNAAHFLMEIEVTITIMNIRGDLDLHVTSSGAAVVVLAKDGGGASKAMCHQESMMSSMLGEIMDGVTQKEEDEKKP